MSNEPTGGTYTISSQHTRLQVVMPYDATKEEIDKAANFVSPKPSPLNKMLADIRSHTPKSRLTDKRRLELVGILPQHSDKADTEGGEV